jgi:hypothetical protein
VDLLRTGENRLIIYGTFDDSLEKIREIFKKQQYKISLYCENDPTRIKAIKEVTPGKKRKGKLHFSIIKNENRSIYIEAHKDRYINGSFKSDHKNNHAKRELNRLQMIIAKNLHAQIKRK